VKEKMQPIDLRPSILELQNGGKITRGRKNKKIDSKILLWLKAEAKLKGAPL
jgi:hypothetical protein